MSSPVRRLLSEETGVTAIEYGLIAALIAVALIGALVLVGGSLSGVFDYVGGQTGFADSVASPNGSCPPSMPYWSNARCWTTPQP